MNEKSCEILRLARLTKKMTLKDLAEKCNLSYSYISQVERGDASPSLSSLSRLAKALDVSVWQLLKDDEEMVNENSLNESELQLVKNEPDPQAANGAIPSSLNTYPLNGHTNQVKLVKKDMRRSIILPRSSIRYQMITPDLNCEMQVLYMEAEAGSQSGDLWFEHEGEECCFVQSGRLDIEVGKEKYILEAGDSLYFPSKIPHHWENNSKEKVIVLLMITPPAY